MSDVAIANDASNGICILTPAGGISIQDAADQYYGANPYDVQDESVLSGLIMTYISSCSWDLNAHVLIEDMATARLAKLDIFKRLCHGKWDAMGVHDNPPDEIIGLFTGQDNTDLIAYRDMVATETPILATYATIALLDAYTPTYLQ